MDSPLPDRLPSALAALLALGTVAAFTLSRIASAADLAPVLLGGVLAATAVAAAALIARGHGVHDAGLVSLGAPVGLGAYLLLALAADGPSTDSPTWLLYALFVGVTLGLGAIGGIAGTLARRVRPASQ